MILSYIFIIVLCLAVAALTLYTGFGLGTLLMPAFAIFFSMEVAIAATAAVHLANNLFKLIFVGKYADWKMLLKFGIPAVLFALAGAYLLDYLSHIPSITNYIISDKEFSITPVKLTIAILMLGFGLMELIPEMEKKVVIKPKYIPLGGALSGFFGGLSGHQGAMRTAFLINTGLDKNAFIGTVAVISILVDLSRLGIYGSTFFINDLSRLYHQGDIGLIAAGGGAAFLGTFLGSLFMKKITMKTIQIIVGILLLSMAIAIGSGLI